MKNLERAIAAYKGMDEIRRAQCLQFMEMQAKAHPAQVAPALKLIVGGKVGDAVTVDRWPPGRKQRP